jgi:hypothetical protein
MGEVPPDWCCSTSRVIDESRYGIGRDAFPELTRAQVPELPAASWLAPGEVTYPDAP